MKKILQINSVVNTGSTGRIVEEIGKLSLNNNFESVIAFGRNGHRSSSETFLINKPFSLYLHGLRTRLLDQHGYGSTKATIKFLNQLDKIKPNLIHLHNIHGYYLNIKVLFEYLSKISKPIVWTFHDCWPITGHCAYFDYVNCTKWKTQCYECPQIRSYPSSLFVDNSKNNYILKKHLFTSLKNLSIVTVSNWLADKLKESFLSKYPIVTIHNGIELGQFKTYNNNAKIKHGLKGKKIILGVANVWDRRKGLKDFIELNDLIDKDKFQIILVGLNKKNIAKLPSNIIGISRTENIKELAELYSSAEVYVNPTWEDSFATTNLESLACGTPVIVYNTGGSIESISDNTGIIVEKGNVSGLLEAVKKIVNSPEKYSEENCIRRAHGQYDNNKNFYKYIELYNRLLQD